MLDQTYAPETIHTLSAAALREQWREAYGSSPPMGLGRDLITRGLGWKAEERAHGPSLGPLGRELARLAGQLGRSGDLDVERQLTLKLGTRLVREWHGRTFNVMVLEEGFLFDERRYASLSEIAGVITGVKWSGPRFFGLRQRARSPRQPGQTTNA